MTEIIHRYQTKSSPKCNIKQRKSTRISCFSIHIFNYMTFIHYRNTKTRTLFYKLQAYSFKIKHFLGFHGLGLVPCSDSEIRVVIFFPCSSRIVLERLPRQASLKGLCSFDLQRIARTGSLVIVVLCIGGCVTYKTGFGLDDWIYCTLYIHNPGLHVITALPLIYTLYSLPLHTH
jgi:hypothetical protein